MVAQILQSSRLPNGRVTIEVTETAAMDNPDRAIAALESWRGHGVNISIDDYGTGQSSLGYLQKLPATELKIDKSFVHTDRQRQPQRDHGPLDHGAGPRARHEGRRRGHRGRRNACSCCARWAATPARAIISAGRCRPTRWPIILIERPRDAA